MGADSVFFAAGRCEPTRGGRGSVDRLRWRGSNSEDFRGALRPEDLWTVSDLDETFRAVLRRRTKIFQQYSRLSLEKGVVRHRAGCQGRQRPHRPWPACLTARHRFMHVRFALLAQSDRMLEELLGEPCSEAESRDLAEYFQLHYSHLVRVR